MTICIKEGCDTRSNFNYVGVKPALYCSKHKLIEMINTMSKRCE